MTVIRHIGIQKCIPEYIQVFVSARTKNKSSITKMKPLTRVFDRVSLSRLITVWISTITVFGIVYFGLALTSHAISYNGQSLTADVYGFGNALYFSFITAATIGYQNLIPTGSAKIFVIIEIIASTTFFGLIIAKLVSVKQQEIITEIKTLSVEETTHNAITQLYLYRNDLNDVLTTKTSKAQIQKFDTALINLRAALELISTPTEKISADDNKALMNMSLLMNSVNFSISKTVEVLNNFNSKHIQWKKESITTTLVSCNNNAKNLYEQYKINAAHETLVGEKLDDLDKTLTALQKSLGTQ